MSNPISDLQRQANDYIDTVASELHQISLDIHTHPELGFQEHRAQALLSGFLERQGLTVERGLAGLDTAFRARASSGRPGPAIAFLAEYDALPEIGHACGHNIMGTSCAAAAAAVKTVINRLAGEVLVIGTPAEEGGGGKILLLERGALAGVDAAMEVHPWARTLVDRGSLASTRLELEFKGKAAHAAAAPQDGINALEAVILTFNGIDALRLHLRPDARVHGIITDGGRAANIIPDHVAAVFSLRARDRAYMEQVVERVLGCARGAAEATGAQLSYRIEPGYADIWINRAMAGRFAAGWQAIGVELDQPEAEERMGSTDMGNVSQVLPAIHPYIAIAPPATAGHTVEIREAAASPAGQDGLLKAAKGMAMLAIDLLADPELMERVRTEFETRSNAQGRR